LRTLPEAVRGKSCVTRILGPLLPGQPDPRELLGDLTQVDRRHLGREPNDRTRVLAEPLVGCGDLGHLWERGDGSSISAAEMFSPPRMIILQTVGDDELAPHGITVNTIPPGFVGTPMARRAEARGDLPSIDAVAAQTPVRTAGTPDDIAAACAFLCSDDAGYITGQQIGLNGGWYL
jgi:Enoyl-(Acyl carrier protein) reductase